ncbi:hypothetical protein AAG587_22340 [Vreelandella neptunia]|uniref:beta strand repeat-containing protein n=1 Tax=Vreelandella neptunia TaxID=115551 RepID=UPI00315AEA63
MAIQGFDKNFYLNAKLAQLQANADTAADWADKDVAFLEARFAAVGLTAEQHYEQYGYQEELASNAYFNPAEYIRAKATAMFNDANNAYQTIDAAAEDFVKLWGGNVYDHYLQYGEAEGVNPSNDFDISSYFQAKLAQLQAAGNTEITTVAELKASLNAAGLTVLEHFIAYGQSEGLTAPAVPESERVSVDEPADEPVNVDTPVPAQTTFTVTEDSTTHAVSFGGTATGDITIAWKGAVGSTVATFTRAGLTGTADFASATSMALGASDTLSASAVNLAGVTISGADGTVTLTDTSLAASTLTTLDAAIAGTLDAANVTTINGTAAEVKAVVNAAGITTAANYAATVSDADADDTVLNAILGDTSGIVTANLAGEAAALNAALTNGNASDALTITLDNVSTDIADISALKGKTSVDVGAGSVVTITSAATTTIDLTAAGVTWASGIKVTGTGGADTIIGTRGTDTIIGGAGDDTLNGGSDAVAQVTTVTLAQADDGAAGMDSKDQMSYSVGSVTMLFSGPHATLDDIGTEFATLANLSFSDDVSARYDAASDTITFTAASAGKAFSVTDVRFYDDPSVVDNGAITDTIITTTPNQAAVAFASDTYTGGAGNDTFIVGSNGATAASDADVIEDFVSKTDKIDFQAFDIAGTGTNYSEASTAVADFAAAKAAADAAFNGDTDTVYAVQQVGSDSYVFAADANNAAAEHVVKLMGVALDGIEFADIVA